MTEKEMEIRDQIEKLANQGRDAALSGNIERSAELILQVQPLMRELAKLTEDDHWNELADEGTELYNNRPRPEQEWEQRR